MTIEYLVEVSLLRLAELENAVFPRAFVTLQRKILKFKNIKRKQKIRSQCISALLRGRGIIKI